MRMSVYTETDYFEELSYLIGKACKSKMCTVSQQAGDPGGSQCYNSSPKPVSGRIPSHSRKVNLFFRQDHQLNR